MAATRRTVKRAKTTSSVRQSASVALREDGSVRVGIVADTHSAPHRRTTELLRRAAPDAILHAGDIGALTVLDDLRTVAPVLAVRGNIDGTDNDLPDELTIALRDEARGETVLTIFLTHIAVYGPKLRADVVKRARSEGAGMVVCGHSHVPFLGRDQGLVVVNPGSVGPRRFHLPIVFGVLDVKRGAVTFEHVSCETGERWLP